MARGATAAATTAAAPVAFSLTPASAKTGNLDNTEKEGRILYDKACAKLVNDEFDCAEDQLLDFMTALKQRADEFRWSGRIPQDPADPTSTKLSLL